MSHDQLRLERVGLRTKGVRRVFLWAIVHSSIEVMCDRLVGGYSTSTNVHELC
jgi:hypothetical protein